MSTGSSNQRAIGKPGESRWSGVTRQVKLQVVGKGMWGEEFEAAGETIFFKALLFATTWRLCEVKQAGQKTNSALSGFAQQLERCPEDEGSRVRFWPWSVLRRGQPINVSLSHQVSLSFSSSLTPSLSKNQGENILRWGLTKKRKWILWFQSREVPRVVMFTDTDSSMVFARAWGERRVRASWVKVSVLQDEQCSGDGRWWQLQNNVNRFNGTKLHS